MFQINITDVMTVYTLALLLYFQPIDERKNLQDNGYTSATARAQAPAQVGLVFRQSGTCSAVTCCHYCRIIQSFLIDSIPSLSHINN